MRLKTTMSLFKHNIIVPENEEFLMYPLSEDSVLLSIKSNTTLYFSGVLEIKVLLGCVEVLGYKIKPKRSEVRIFSLIGGSALGISAATESYIDSDNSINIIMDLNFTIMESTRIVNFAQSSGAVFILLATSKNFPNFDLLEKCDIKVLPKIILTPSDPLNKAEMMLKCVLDLDSGFKIKNKLKVKHFPTLQVDDIIKRIERSELPHIAVCGGKGVGKSTMMRYILNRILNVVNKCLFIDFDIGQTEFTPPGSISVVIVEKPLLGPNFSHIINPLRCTFLGEVDPMKCTEKYIETLNRTMEYCWSMPELLSMPWCLNTMGFPTGTGLILTLKALHAFKPTILIQFKSLTPKNNLPPLMPEYVNSEVLNDSDIALPLKYDFYEADSPSEADPCTGRRSLSGVFCPVKSRNAMFLSYFGQNTSDIIFQSPVLCKKILISPVEEVSLHVGSLVGLSKLLRKENNFDCLGYGILRGFDFKSESYLLITPVGLSTLAQVDCLQVGSIPAPIHLLTQINNDIYGKLPHLTLSSSYFNGCRPAKRRLKAIKSNARLT